MNPQMKISVLLVDDHNVVREGLRALLQSETDIEVVGEAENGRDAVALASQLQPNIVLMDVALPLLNGCDATRKVRRAVPSAKVLVLSSYNDVECVDSLLEAGASGYLLKHTAGRDLAGAIRQVKKGALFLSPEIVRERQRNRQAAFATGQTGDKRRDLTARESQVLHLIAEGFSNKEISKELGISIKTVEKHRQQVMNKLNIHEVAGLTRFAIAHSVVDLRSPAAGTTAGHTEN